MYLRPFNAIFAFQPFDLGCTLDEEAGTLLHGCSLVDRVGCPLSVRLYRDAARATCRVCACSESSSVGAEALTALLGRFSAALECIAEAATLGAALARIGAVAPSLSKPVSVSAPTSQPTAAATTTALTEGEPT